MSERSRLREIALKQFGIETAEELVEAPDSDFEEAWARTHTFLAELPTHRPILLGAAFEHDGVRVRIDALVRFIFADRLIEVVAGASPTEEDYWDCAIQTWVMRGAGRPVQIVSIASVIEDFILACDESPQGLLRLDDCTDHVDARLPCVSALVPQFRAVVAGPQPHVDIGRHCSEPYDCPFLKHCHASELASRTVRLS